MSDVPRRGQNCIDRQADLFRLAARDHGLSIGKLHQLTDISESTLKGWRAGAAMPAWALFALGDVGVPDHLLSMVGSAYGKHVGTDEPDDGDLDALGRETAHFTAAKLDAEADGTVTHIERARLKERAARIAGVARRAAA